MKAKTVRFLCLLLCLLMLVPFSLTACGGGGDDNGDGTTKAPTNTVAPDGGEDDTIDLENPNFTEWVEVYDMGVDGGARQINFLTYTDYNTSTYFFRHEGDADLEDGDALAIAAGSRTMAIEEAYKVAFNVIDNDKVGTTLQASVMGNGGEYDLIYPHPTVEMNTILTNGLLQNLYAFDAIDLSKPWWNQDQVHAYSIDDWLVLGVNNMSICGQSMVSIVYNKDIYSQEKIGEDLYGMVYNGQWTVGALKTMAMKFGEGAGDDMILDQNDKCGWFANYHNYNYWAFGGRVFDKDANGEFYIAIDATQADQMSKALYDILWSSEDKVWCVQDPSNNATFGSSKVLAAFYQGNALFYTYDLGALYKHLWNCSFDVGYLPYPMLNTEQDAYYSASSAGFFGIPQKVADKKASGILLEALAIHSYTHMRKTFFETILLSRMSENPEDYKMLSFIHDTKIYDWGLRHIVEHERQDSPSSQNFLVYYVVTKKQESVSGYVSSRKKLWDRLLDDLSKIRNSEFEG
ncbi:MAG: hypothetical protein IKB75_02845 [Clostridia bacterium]|nr:hypothetical protein [Clostridia bacterium]